MRGGVDNRKLQVRREGDLEGTCRVEALGMVLGHGTCKTGCRRGAGRQLEQRRQRKKLRERVHIEKTEGKHRTDGGVHQYHEAWGCGMESTGQSQRKLSMISLGLVGWGRECMRTTGMSVVAGSRASAQF